MELQPTTDNNGGNYRVPDEHCDNLLAIGNRSVETLCQENPDLLIFPQSLGLNHDDIAKSPIFVLQDRILTTHNMMGFVGRGATRLTISSRFCKDDRHDYFLHYMLQRVFAINLFDFEQTSNDESIWDFLLYLFPYYLKLAYRQGIYRTYVRNEYNDAYVKGRIDVNRHIRMNVPFRGQIAYSTREYSADNPMIQLIRHTIEYISNHPLGKGVLMTDAETRDAVRKIRMMTQSSYQKNDRQRVVIANMKRFSHPYYTAYVMLQKICMQILRRDKISFGEKESKIYGLLFDGAWLWEEFIHKTILSECGFSHPQNRAGKGGIYLFDKNDSDINFVVSRCKRYPDYFKENFILDAKYKHLDNNRIDRNDMHQIISYMHVEKANIGGFIYPRSTMDIMITKLGNLRGYAGVIYNIGVPIPQKKETYTMFCLEMQNIQEELKRKILELS